MVKSLDPRTPVLVGAAQLSNRVDQDATPLEPVDLIARVAEGAAADSGGRGVLAALDSVRVVKSLSWRYRDPGSLIASRVGATARQTMYSTDGGQTPQAMVNRSAAEIARGELDLVLVCGGESWRTRQDYRKRNEKPPWTDYEELPTGPSTFEPYGAELDMVDAAELARGLGAPVQMYAIFEVALRASLGLSVADHRARLGRLWSEFSHVAATNPHAWIRTPMTPEEVATPTPSNRLIGHPYTLVMNSNNNVEQAAAVLVCSAERADALGIPRDRWVFPQVGTEANDIAHVSNRNDLCSSPALRTAGRALFEAAGIGPDDLGPVDLYSCFPSAVQIAAKELGLGIERPLTVTGGMSFAGGPWNNYATHGIAAMVDALRKGDPGELGLCSANGGFTTKHALGLYSTEPAAEGFRHVVTQEAADEAAAPGRTVTADDHAGTVEIEAYTVMHGRDGTREVGLVATLSPDGQRAWCSTNDDDTMAALVDTEWCGQPAQRHADGSITLDAA